MKEKTLIVIELKNSEPVKFYHEKCNGCNRCVEVCQVDLFIPNPKKGKPPIIVYPDECWYCGTCVDECPNEGAIKFNPLVMNRVHWKE